MSLTGEKTKPSNGSRIVINPDFVCEPSHAKAVLISPETRKLLGEDMTKASNNEMEILPEASEGEDVCLSDEEIAALIKEIESDEKKK